MNIIQKIAVNNISTSDFISWKTRAKILKHAGFKLGSHVIVKQHIFFQAGSISIGSDSFINRYCTFQDSGHNANFTIGDNVFIGPNCTFLGVTHEIGDSKRRAMKAYSGDIVVEDGCWLGGNVTVLPGVTIKKGCIVGAGAVVTKDTEPDGLYAGIPAKKIKELDN